MNPSRDYRALICINTCARLAMVQRCLPHYAAFVRDDPRFSLVVSLDGTDGDYLGFGREWSVPLIWSEEREGVGLSKNRVLERYPDYDYYFFLEDDVELADGTVFPAHVAASRASQIHHFSLFRAGGLRQPTHESRAGDFRIRHGRFGGAQFNFFTREGLRRVGGWHPAFAEYRRGGHTEHSYRFPRVGLAPAPFNVLDGMARCLVWHHPPAVTRVQGVQAGADGLLPLERELMDQELEHVPVQTLSPVHDLGVPPGGSPKLAGTLTSGDRYPLVQGDEKREARSAYEFWRAEESRRVLPRLWHYLRAGLLWPGNPLLRRRVKRRLGLDP